MAKPELKVWMFNAIAMSLRANEEAVCADENIFMPALISVKTSAVLHLF